MEPYRDSHQFRERRRVHIFPQSQAVRSEVIAPTRPSDGSYSQVAQDIKNVAGKEDIDTELMQLVLAILNSADNLKTNGHLKWKSSIIQTVVSTAVMSRPIR